MKTLKTLLIGTLLLTGLSAHAGKKVKTSTVKSIKTYSNVACDDYVKALNIVANSSKDIKLLSTKCEKVGNRPGELNWLFSAQYQIAYRITPTQRFKFTIADHRGGHWCRSLRNSLKVLSDKEVRFNPKCRSSILHGFVLSGKMEIK